MTSYCITCTSDNIEKIIPRLYINNIYIDQNNFQKQYNGTINVAPNNSFLGEMPTYATPLNFSCGDETTFSKPVTVMGIKGIVYYDLPLHQLTVVYILVDPPHFNCTLSIAGSVVSWSQCVNSRDYINYYIVSISDAQSKINTTSNIMKTYINFQSYPCGTTYQISVQPVNIVGEGVAAMVNYTYICPTSSGGECSNYLVGFMKFLHLQYSPILQSVLHIVLVSALFICLNNP